MHQIRNQSMDAVYSQHCLEHLTEIEAWRAVQEMVRVLRPSGYALVVVPNVKSACQWIAEGRGLETAYWSEAGPVRPLDILYSCQYLVADSGNPFMSHRFGYTKESLGVLFQRFGFADVRVAEDPWELTCLAFVKEKDRGENVGSE